MKEKRRFERSGFLAIHPQALTEIFVEQGPPVRAVRELDGLSVIDVQGPLVHHVGDWPDSYEAIVDRVTQACALPAPTIVMRVDSPGGDMHGAFDAARMIRERTRASGKRLVAWIEGHGCSAAYAIAAAADHVTVSPTACVGSIGVLAQRTDVSKADAAMGVGVTLVVSGARKPDLNAHTSMSPQEHVAMQAQVDALAGVFFELVSAFRPGLTPDTVRGLEAGTFIGQSAVDLGLADGVATDLRAAAAAGNGEGGAMTENRDDAAPAAAAETSASASPSSSQQDVDDARAALQRAANDGSAKAREALAVLTGGDDDDDDDDDDDADDDETPDASASVTPAPTAAAAGATVSARAAASLGERVDQLERHLATVRAERDASQLSALLAGRKDLTKEFRSHLRTMAYVDAKKIIDLMPRGASGSVEVEQQVRATRGHGETGDARNVVPSDPKMAAAFRRGPQTSYVTRADHSIEFRAPEGGFPRPKVATPAAAPAASAPSAQLRQTGEGGNR